MSIRQRSFFDQDRGSKAKPNWQKGRTFEKSHSANDAIHKLARPRSPIKASTQSRTKLRSFEFEDSMSTVAKDKDDKENVPTVAPNGKTPSKDHAADEGRPLPSTPALRLPLADLIGNAEDAMRRRPEKEKSPEEQLGWVPNSSSSQTPGRRRKRAYSSSPSSSQFDTSNHLPNKEVMDVQALQQSFRTPRADPAADLWSRYASGTGGDENPAGLNLPAFAQLMAESSPRSVPRTPGGSVGGLRRWASCGMEWPASKAKRRRVSGPFKAYKDDVFADAEISTLPEEESKTSRVGMLVEQIQANLAAPAESTKPAGPSSSSPLPDKGGFPSDLVKPMAIEYASRATDEHYAAAREAPEQEETASALIHPTQSSDYGAAEFDIDVDAIDSGYAPPASKDLDMQSQRAATAPATEIASVPHGSGGLSQKRQNTEEAQRDVKTALEAIAELAGEDFEDDFEDDLDITAEDLDSAVPLFTGKAAPTSDEAFVIHHVPQEIQDDDDFGVSDIDDDQFAAAEIAATQAYSTSAATHTPKVDRRAIQRYRVREVVTGQYTNERNVRQVEKTIFVDEEVTRVPKIITLRQSWLDTHCTTGAYVHVVGNFSKTGEIIIDDAQNLFVVHPDYLVSATAVADSFDCLRKAVLQDRVKATNATSKPTVYGSILHEIFQKALQEHCWDTEWLDELVQRTVTKYIEGLFEAGAIDTNEALEHLRSKMPELRAWASAFVAAVPPAEATVEDRNGKKVRMSLSKLLDVEEHVWSPMYGLKGNIDASVEVVMEDEHGQRTLTVPFEVKTGKYQSPAHRAQTALYTLLLSDRYDIDIVYGVLYYMETSAVTRIPAIRNELRHMVMQRNELASYVRERRQLPPMLRNPFKCGRCYAKTSCFLYHKLAEDGTTETAGVKDKFDQVAGKLRPPHQDFFKKWDDLLTKEESEVFKYKRELWTMLSHHREKVGRCFAEVVIERGSSHEQENAEKINRFSYTFVKASLKPGFSFNESQITTGEPIVISSEQGHFALANGYVTKVSPSRISVAVDRKLQGARKRQHGFDERVNQSFRGIMEVGKHTLSRPNRKDEEEEEEEQVVYRLDKDEFSNGMATVRNNLLAIMDDNVYRSYELRSLIIENVPPAFKPTPTTYTLSGPPSQLHINSDQRAAIDKVMSAQDYALVLGMPGTGKTTTIAHIIRALVARGKSVLLTSYTHTAVDNILLKVRDPEISILRLGNLAKVHPGVQEFARLAAAPPASIEELQDMYMTPQVVATTCLGISHQIFHKRVFDYCIVDEASQITLPVCLGPIRMAKTFVLVGDHYQLPPLVQNKEAQEQGLDISLFKLLSDRQPSSVVNLEHQYRMCEEVMLLSNKLIYDGRLKCGNEDVAHRTLRVPDADGLQRYHPITLSSQPLPQSTGGCSGMGDSCWLTQLLNPRRKVVFANTDTITPKPLEAARGSRIVNTTEATLVAQTVLGLISQGINPSDIGVITFYRSQLALLRQTLRNTAAEHVEMHTADKFQGRDKEVIVLSCVRSNEVGNVGDLLKDWRRVNVAFTRARSKLVVLGSRDTLRHNDVLKGFLDIIDQQGWSVALPGDAGRDHDFGVLDESGAAQVTPMKDRASVGKPAASPGEGKMAGLDRPGSHDARLRKVLGESRSSENRGPIGCNSKKPDKVGQIKPRALGKMRPVLKDLVTEILGEDTDILS